MGRRARGDGARAARHRGRAPRRAAAAARRTASSCSRSTARSTTTASCAPRSAGATRSGPTPTARSSCRCTRSDGPRAARPAARDVRVRAVRRGERRLADRARSRSGSSRCTSAGGRTARLAVASEMKALVGDLRARRGVPARPLPDAPRRGAGALLDARLVRLRRRAGPRASTPAELRDALADAVHSHLMTDVPYGVLLSGGLDSSVDRRRGRGLRRASASRSGDREARLVAAAALVRDRPRRARPTSRRRSARPQAIGTVHHGFEFTVQEGLDALRDVIWHIESFDTTTVRASTPMYLMARRIRATGVKMVLSGEGADEIFGGYLYFHKAPTPARVPRRDSCASCSSCTSTTACARTSRWRPGASRRACRSSTRASSTSRCASRPRQKMVAPGGIEKQHPARGVPRRPARRDPVAAEGAVLGRRRLLAGSTRSRRTPASA